MNVHLRYGVACSAALTLWCVLSLPVGAQNTEYTIKPLPPGGPAPRLADGHPDLSGHWLPNGAGQGISGRFGVDPAARGQFDPKVTPEEPPSFQPWALAKIKSMTPTELELSKSSVNCMPRGVPAIWLQNPYSTMLVHTPSVLAQLFEVLNNWRVIHLDGRPLPRNPEPWFHGNSIARRAGTSGKVKLFTTDPAGPCRRFLFLRRSRSDRLLRGARGQAYTSAPPDAASSSDQAFVPSRSFHAL